MYFYFRLIPNFNSGRVKKKPPNDPTCEWTNTQIDIWGKKHEKEKTKKHTYCLKKNQRIS